MRSIFRSTRFNEVTITDYPEGFIAGSGIFEEVLLSEHKHARGLVRSTFLNGIHIEQRQVTLTEELTIEVQHDFPFLKMQFELEGYSLFKSDIGSIPDVEIKAQTHQLFYLPEVKGRLNYNKNRNTLEIKLSIDFLNRIFMNDLSPLLHFGEAIAHGHPVLLASAPMPITFEMRNIIAEVTNCKYSGLMKRVFLECKVSELLLLQVAQHAALKPVTQPIKKSDLEKLYYVKELIEKNIENPLTILQLAELAGINDFKLKRDFKQVFGHTLFGYLTTVRLARAKDLILNGYPINEVSYLTGYKHHQHFTAAFKKNYGCLPSKMIS